MPTYVDQCPDCNSAMKVSFGETIIGDSLRWYISSNCSNCDFAEEVDGGDQLPDDLRDSVIALEGLWQLTLISLGDDPVETMKALKHVLKLSYRDVSALKVNLSTVIYTGTKTEMQFVRYKLLAISPNIAVSIEYNQS